MKIPQSGRFEHARILLLYIVKWKEEEEVEDETEETQNKKKHSSWIDLFFAFCSHHEIIIWHMRDSIVPMNHLRSPKKVYKI